MPTSYDIYDGCRVTIGGDIGGSGKLIVGDCGSGTLVLSGRNTYTGGTRVRRNYRDGVTLLVANPAALPDYDVPGKIDVDYAATLAVRYGGAGDWTAADVDMLRANVSFESGGCLGLDTTNATGGATYGSVITGELSFTKLGANNLTLSAANTYSGGTSIRGGTLTLGHVAALQNSTLLYDGGTLSFGTLTAAILGGLDGNKGLELTNVNGQGVLLALSTDGASSCFSGVLSGAGSVYKSGDGTVVLSGDNTYAGGTMLAAGRLCIDGDTALGTGPFSIVGESIIDCTAHELVTLTNNNPMIWNADFAFGRPGEHGHHLNLGLGSVILDDDRVVTVNGRSLGHTSTLVVGGSISGEHSLTKAGLGGLFLTGTSSYTGGTYISEGTLGFGRGGLGTVGSIIVTGNSTLQWHGTNTEDISDRLRVNSGITVALDTGGNDVVLADNIGLTEDGDPTTASLIKNGGGSLTLCAANTFSGSTIVSDGTLILQNDAALGTAPGTVTVTDGAILQLEHDTGIAIRSKDLFLETTLCSSRGANTWGGTITIDRPACVRSDSESLTLDAPTAVVATGGIWTFWLSGTGDGTVSGSITGDLSVEKRGTGKWTLTAANTFTASTRVSDGVLNIQHGEAIGISGKVTVYEGATLELEHGTGFTVEDATLTLEDNRNSINGALRNISGNNAWNGPVIMDDYYVTVQSDSDHLVLADGYTIQGARRNMTFRGAGDGTVAGTISAMGVLTKEGTGTWTLSKANFYTGGTIVNAGTLNVTNTTGSATGSGAVTIHQDGTLAGSGIIDGLLTVEGTLAPGDGTGILTVDNQVTFEAGATFDVELDGLVAGSEYDQLAASGLLSLNGSLQADFGQFSPTGDDILIVIDNTGVEAIAGTFQYADDAYIGTFNGCDWHITYDADNGIVPSLDGGNDVAIYSVPEPSLAGLLAVVGIYLLGSVRRASRSTP